MGNKHRLFTIKSTYAWLDKWMNVNNPRGINRKYTVNNHKPNEQKKSTHKKINRESKCMHK